VEVRYWHRHCYRLYWCQARRSVFWFSQLCLLDVETWFGDWDGEWVCDNLGVKELDIYRTPPFIKPAFQMRVSQSVELFGCLMWNTPLSLFHSREKLLLAFPQKFSTKTYRFHIWISDPKGLILTFLFGIAH
jgi:hypothetical protein